MHVPNVAQWLKWGVTSWDSQEPDTYLNWTLTTNKQQLPYSKSKEKIPRGQYFFKLLLCGKDSCVDVSLHTTILISSIQCSFVIYPLYSHNLHLLPLLSFISYQSLQFQLQPSTLSGSLGLYWFSVKNKQPKIQMYMIILPFYNRPSLPSRTTNWS